jgi:hypothetical protein
MDEIPFCDQFHVQERISLEPMPDGNILVVKEFGLEFSKDTFAQSLIEAMLRVWQQKAGSQLLDFLRQRATGASSTAPPPRVVEVWELQRRLTLFHVTWTAPFLPHDGEKQWRWVDTRYRKHPWTLGTQCSSAGAAVPPIRPPMLTLAAIEANVSDKAEWAVVRTQGPCDADGWQYANEFYEGDALWDEASTFCHCRRRLWRRCLDACEECPAGPEPEDEPERREAPCLSGSGATLRFIILALASFLVLVSALLVSWSGSARGLSWTAPNDPGMLYPLSGCQTNSDDNGDSFNALEYTCPP